MTMLSKVLVVLMVMIAGAAQAKDDAINCGNCKEWNKPVKPFNVYGNTWYVGVNGLSSVLITSPRGHILVDGALWLKSGTHGADDPQFHADSQVHVRKVAKVRVVRDGETLRVDAIGITAHMTPGHTPGATTWSWTSCEGTRCMNVVYADSLNPISRDGFNFTGKGATPDISASFRQSIDKVAALKCDIVLSAHPSGSDTFAKAAGRTPERNPFVDADGCRAYAAVAAKLLDERLARERAGH